VCPATTGGRAAAQQPASTPAPLGEIGCTRLVNAEVFINDYCGRLLAKCDLEVGLDAMLDPSDWGVLQPDVRSELRRPSVWSPFGILLTLRSQAFRVQPDTSGQEGSVGGQRVGYIRVSAIDQRSDRQFDGEPLERTFTDTASGKDVRRPELEAMVGFVRDGDTVVCHSMDRLARNLDDLRSIVRTLTAKGVQVHFVKEQLTFTGDDTAMATLLLSVMGAFAEFERSLIRERQREGIELAKKRGAYRGRRRSLTDDQVAELRRRVAEGVPKAVLARELGVSRETLYQYLRADSSGSGAAEAQGTPKPPAEPSV